MGTLVFADGSTMQLESAYLSAMSGILYLRVNARLSELAAFENENKTQVMRCEFDGQSLTFRGYVIPNSVVTENDLVRVAMEKNNV